MLFKTLPALDFSLSTTYALSHNIAALIPQKKVSEKNRRWSMSRGPGCVRAASLSGLGWPPCANAPGLRCRFGWPPEKAEVDGSSNFYALGLRQKPASPRCRKFGTSTKCAHNKPRYCGTIGAPPLKPRLPCLRFAQNPALAHELQRSSQSMHPGDAGMRAVRPRYAPAD